MSIDRRNFIKTSLVGAAAVGVGGSLKASSNILSADEAPTYPIKAELKLSFQEGTAPGVNLNEKFDFMEKHGVVGFEPHGNNITQRLPEYMSALKGRNIKVSAICAGFEGFILSTDATIRKKFHTSMQEIIIAAGELGSVGVIFVPAFNSQVPVMPHTQETRDFLCKELDELGTFAKKYGTTIILEPLNRREAFYMRQVADAASVCRDINNPGVTCLGDFWHMTHEETSDMAAFISAGKYLQHVHMASRKRRSMPGEDGAADNYVDGFKGLKLIGYDKYVSFECGCQGDRNLVVPEAIKLLRKQWDEA